MGDHRATISITFEMHGVTTQIKEMWINWWEGAAHDMPSAVKDFFADAEAKSMNAWQNEQDKARDVGRAKAERLKASARAKLTDEEWDAINHND